jgi:hypothetical protein
LFVQPFTASLEEGRGGGGGGFFLQSSSNSGANKLAFGTGDEENRMMINRLLRESRRGS